MLSPITLAEKKVIPDALIRVGIKRLCKQRLVEEDSQKPALQTDRYASFLSEMSQSPLAIETDAANEQHYEVPARFYELSLGEHLKYSSAYWDETTTSLTEAEAKMLQLTCERAGLVDGQDILELGCGWGSLSLWMASHYPNSKVTSLSNSNSQREHIQSQAKKRGLDNLEIITSDINDFSTNGKYDRIVSVEMFEHLRNYELLFSRINRWLKDDGKLFFHVFCHRYLMYPFEVEGEDNWLGKYFFTGGLMPAADTFLNFQQHLVHEKRWLVDGTHYQKTAEAWLANMDKNKQEILDVFKQTYGANKAAVWVQRWRMFYMSCAELFGYDDGCEWMVAHFLFSKR